MKKFVLASASPRRRELLTEYGYEFEVVPSGCDENVDKALPPKEYVKALAVKKAEYVFDKTGKPTLGADTVVVLDGVILGKPKDTGENVEFLQKLSGRSHFVYTGFAFVDNGKIFCDVSESEVVFNELADELIKSYVFSGKGLDKAGGYGIQDGYPLVERIKGSYTNIVGLPMEEIEKLFKGLI